MHLVEKLFQHGLSRHAAASVRKFGNGAGTVLIHIGEGIADERKVLDILDARIGEVAAGHLRAAFQQMSDHRAATEPSPVIAAPTMSVDERTQDQGGIGTASCDDDVRPRVQRIGNLVRAKISICTNDGALDVAQGLIAFH
jgi:hypothetical protein